MAWIIARGVVALGFVGAAVISKGWHALVRDDRVREGLFAWDGGFYRDIAVRGYGPRGSEGLRFFPFYPISARAASWLVFGNVQFALLLIANVSAFAAMCWLRDLVEDITGDERLGRLSMWWLALFPSAAMLAFAYSESVALALSIGAVWAARRGRWAVAAAAAMAMGACRPVGVLIALPLLAELWDRPTSLDGEFGPGLSLIARRTRAVLVAGSPVIGTGAYLAWVWLTRVDWWAPMRLQSQLRAGFHEPISRTASALIDVVSGQFRDAYNLGFVAVFAVGLVGCFLLRIPVLYTAYGAITVAVALSANNIDSVGRYGLVAFPLIVGLAHVTSRWRVERLALVGSSLALVVFTVAILVRGVIP